MELFPAANDEAWSLIRRVVDESDYYLFCARSEADGGRRFSQSCSTPARVSATIVAHEY